MTREPLHFITVLDATVPRADAVKAALLACLTEEPVAHIRRKVTHAVGQLAGVSRPEDEVRDT